MEISNDFSLTHPENPTTQWRLEKPNTNLNSQIHSLKFDQFDRYLAIQHSTSQLTLYSITNLSKSLQSLSPSIHPQVSQDTNPCIKWKPGCRNKAVFISLNTDGSLDHWNANSSKPDYRLFDSHSLAVCADFAPDGKSFAFGTSNRNVVVMDEAYSKAIHCFQPGTGGFIGHSGRITCVKFDPENSNVLASAGSDRLVQVWDLRIARAVKAIFGPDIRNDALDIRDNAILAGSCRETECLQVFDISTGVLIYNIDQVSPPPVSGLNVLSCQFSPSNRGLQILLVMPWSLQVFDTVRSNNQILLFTPKNSSNFTSATFLNTSLDICLSTDSNPPNIFYLKPSTNLNK